MLFRPLWMVSAGFALTVLIGLSASCSSSQGPSTSNSPTVTSIPATTIPSDPSTSTSAAPSWNQPEVCSQCGASLIATIPLGQSGITYKYVGLTETEPIGPSSMALSETGVIYVLDSAGLGILSVKETNTERFQLDWPDIRSLLDVAVDESGIRILDVNSKNQARDVRVSESGQFENLNPFPDGLQLATGLSGIAAGPDGQIWVELEGGAKVAELSPDYKEFEITPGYPLPDGVYGPIHSEPLSNVVEFRAGGVSLSITTSPNSYASAHFMGVNPDGSFVVQVSETTQDDEGLIRVEASGHLYRRDGRLLAIAHIPLESQFLFVNWPTALGPDGSLYFLQTRVDEVAVLKLPWASP